MPEPASTTGHESAHRRGRARPTPTVVRRSLREWVHSRPFWAGLCTLLAGAALIFVPGGNLSVLLLPGVAGVSGFLFGAGLGALGLFFWLQPHSRAFTGVATILISVASLITTNLGGLLLGMLLGILGGSLGVAWTPENRLHGRRPTQRRPDQRRTSTAQPARGAGPATTAAAISASPDPATVEIVRPRS